MYSRALLDVYCAQIDRQYGTSHVIKAIFSDGIPRSSSSITFFSLVHRIDLPLTNARRSHGHYVCW